MRAVVVVAVALVLGAIAGACDGEIRLGVPSAELASTDGGGLDGGGDASGASADATAFGACVRDEDCALEGLHCATTKGACVECREDADCRTSDRTRCDATSGRCIGCRGDADCGPEKRCESSTHACVDRCSASRPCSRGTCELATERCLECSASLACSDGDVCNGSNICVECTRDADCVDEESARCDVLLGRCVQCTSNADCASGLDCDPSSGECHSP